MAYHFSEQEFANRRARAIELMQAEGLDGLLLFRQESMYYISGYDSFGYVFFQSMLLSADGEMFLLTRSADLRQARHTSVLKDDEIHIWLDSADAQPAEDLKKLLKARGFAGKRLGVEYLAYGLSAYLGKRLDEAMEGFCELRDASFLMSRLRSVKSAAEIAYVRRAAELADDAWHAAYEVFRHGEGCDEGDILAAQQGAIFRGGGDYPGNEFIIGSGEDALLCRYKTGRRKLSANDQLTLEWAGVYRHYHAAMMRTAIFGKCEPLQKRMFDAVGEALSAVAEALRPGQPCGAVFDAHARVFDGLGFGEHRLAACGYSLGAVFSPNWMDWPHLYHGNSTIIEAGMVFFCHMILMDSVNDFAMSVGHTFLITESGSEALSSVPVALTHISG